MCLRNLAALLGVAVGTALGLALSTSQSAAADAIDDAWPYGTTTPMSLPGISVDQPTNVHNIFGGLWFTQDQHVNLADGGYSTHQSLLQVPFVGYHASQEVFESTVPFPGVGAFTDFLSLPGLVNSFLYDPATGVADTLSLVPPNIQNTLIVDAAGIKDTVSVLEQPPVTIFEIPFESPTSSGAAGSASDFGDGFQQLVAEFPGTTPGLDTLFDPGTLF
jgi:hypothetical protein